MAGRIFAALLIFAAMAAAAGCKHAAPLPPNVSRLIAELRSPDLRRRQDAAVALGKVQPLPPEVIEAMAEAVKAEEAVQSADPSDGFQLFALQVLSDAGAPAIPELAALAKSQNLLTRTRAIQALGRVALHDSTAWPILIGAFKQAGQQTAAQELGKLGPPVLPLLRKSLKDSDPRVRAGAAEALAQMRSLARMLRTLTITPPGILLATPADLARAAPDLSEALEDTDSNVRNQAAIALAWVDPSDIRAIPILTQLMEGKDTALGYTAFLALQNMKSGAKGAAPVLERMLASNPVPSVRVDAAHALASSAGPAACEPLARAAADDRDANVRIAAISAMTRVEPPCPQALPALTQILGQRQVWAVDALARLGKSAVPALAAALKSPDLYVRQDAVGALAQMKPPTSETVQTLMIALKDKSLEVRSAAVIALQDAGGEAERAALAEQTREEQAYAERSKPDTRRYNRQQVIAAIPAGADHKYPLTLAYLFPIYPIGGSAQEAEFLITLHTGKDRPERLVFWKKTGDDQYRRVKVIESDDPDFAEQHFETPITFIAKVRENGSRFGETQLFVDVPVDGWRSHIDQVFALDYGVEGDEQPVEIESPEKSYKSKLGPREAARHPGRNSFSNSALEFAFSIWNANDPECCPTGGQVVGTYKIIKETRTPSAWGAPALGAFAPGSGESARSILPTRAPKTKWTMLVDTAIRKPIPRLAKRTQ